MIYYDVEDFSTLARRERLLEEMFGPDWEEMAFLVSEPAWGSRVKLKHMDDERGCYWSPGAVPWGKAKTYENATSVRCLVLDDVGTKMPHEAAMGLPIGPPCLIVETSAGNYQYVYKFALACPKQEFDRFRAALLGEVAGASDGKAAVQFFRLPWGVNRKPGRDMFRVRGLVGSPERPAGFPVMMNGEPGQ